jgi:hypothetical protein
MILFAFNYRKTRCLLLPGFAVAYFSFTVTVALNSAITSEPFYETTTPKFPMHLNEMNPLQRRGKRYRISALPNQQSYGKAGRKWT